MKTLWIVLVIFLPLTVTAKKTHNPHPGDVYSVNSKAPLYINQLIRQAGKRIVKASEHNMKYTHHGDTTYGYVRTWASYSSRILRIKPQVTVKVYSTSVKGKTGKPAYTRYLLKFFGEEGIYYIAYDNRQSTPFLKYNETGWRTKANLLPTNNELNTDIASAMHKLITSKLPYSYEQ